MKGPFPSFEIFSDAVSSLISQTAGVQFLLRLPQNKLATLFLLFQVATLLSLLIRAHPLS